MRLFLIALALSVSSPCFASTPDDIDFVKERLLSDGYQPKKMELELNLKPRHQFSHFMAPAAGAVQKLFNSDLVTMKYYDVRFETAQGYRYSCVAGIGSSEGMNAQSRYVEIENCAVAVNEEGTFLKPKVIRLKQ